MALDPPARAKGGGGGSGGTTDSVQKGRNYLQEVWVELVKTKWPTREEAIRLTTVVVIVIFVLGAYMGALDFILSSLVTKFQLMK